MKDDNIKQPVREDNNEKKEVIDKNNDATKGNFFNYLDVYVSFFLTYHLKCVFFN